MHGGYWTNMAMHNADLLIAVGARFDDRVTGKLAEFCPEARVVHIDIDPTSIKKTFHAHIPIVGDAKYGGPEAFLTGGISRKLHLHARRIRLDAPEDGKIDVSADLPPHFSETVGMLGFDPLAGDSLSLEQKPAASREGQQRKVAAAAKARRRERRGERRARGSQGKAKRR